MSNPQNFRLFALKTWDLSFGRASWILPVGAWMLYLLIFFATWPALFDDIFTPVVLAFLSFVCLLLALFGLGGRHRVSAIVGLLLNGVVVGGAVWVVSNFAIIVKS
jgi:hypothetical protein